MRAIERTEARAPAAGRPRTTRRQDLTTALFGTWMIVGGGIDGWAHRTRGDTIESFFTPWHAALYSGFTACALWMAWLVLRPMRNQHKGRAVVPVGYGLGLAGAIVFGVGGVADMVWHTIFGIEVSIEALLSPTHLILFIGAMLVLTTPMRAAWLSSEPSSSPHFGEFVPILLSVLLTQLEILFFFQYMSPIIGVMPTRGFYQYLNGLQREFQWVPQFVTTSAIAGVLITNVIVMAFVVLILRRWRPPVGALGVLFLATGVLISGLEDFRQIAFAIPLALGGLAGDVLVARLRPSAERRQALWAVASIVPLVAWSGYFAMVHLLRDGLGWSVEMWSGVIAFTAFSGFALALVTVPPRGPLEV